MPELIRTRFAPSPTGYLHIGGARTALFNYLLARRLDGRFLLRIEDTDQTRNISGATEKLLADMRWLGLHWDEGPEVGGPAPSYLQSARQRQGAYQAVARQLLDSGRAYYAFETREELDAMRRAAQAQKRAFRYPRPSRLPSEQEANEARAAGRPVVIRFLMPDHDFVVKDAILGEVRVGAREVDDFVVVKADGWPTYHFAVVVDDEAMRVTHVLRGQEHLMNTPNHLGLQEALGYRMPVYAHLPIILNLDGSKMSKREKDAAVRTAYQARVAAGTLDEGQAREWTGCDVDTFAAWRDAKTQLPGEALAALARQLGVVVPEIEIHDFRVSGYLPEVLLNFIALLGWSPGNDLEKMTLQEMCERFELERIGKTNARFDRAKLLNFNTTALAAADAKRNLDAFRDFLEVNPQSPLRGLGEIAMTRLLAMNEGFRTVRDIEAKSGMLFLPDDRFPIDESAVRKNLEKGDAAALLKDMRAALAEQTDWSPAALEQLIRGFAEARSLGLGKVAQPLRVAVTGGTVSPPIFDTVALLGRERALKRIDRTLAELERRRAAGA